LLLRRDLLEEALLEEDLREDDPVDDEPLREREREELPRSLRLDLDEPDDSPLEPDSEDCSCRPSSCCFLF
jgi:hypothetical protein